MNRQDLRLPGSSGRARQTRDGRGGPTGGTRRSDEARTHRRVRVYGPRKPRGVFVFSIRRKRFFIPEKSRALPPVYRFRERAISVITRSLGFDRARTRDIRNSPDIASVFEEYQ